MTKKHFKALAEKLHAERASFIMACKSEEPFNRMVRIISDTCAELNDRFDYQRFSDACNGRPYRK
jgi:hypothetical protein